MPGGGPALSPALAALVAAALAAGAGAIAPMAPAAPAGGCAPAGIAGAAAAVRVAQERYRLEARGAAVGTALARVAGDRVLVGALRAGNLAAAGAQARREVAAHHHITAIRVLRAGRVIVETTRYPFDVAGAQTALRDRRGAPVWQLQVTIQDLIGFIRLVHKFTGSQVVVRGAGGAARSSLAAALGARLPRDGCTTVAGRAYAVRSFTETSFTGDGLTIWVLKAA